MDAEKMGALIRIKRLEQKLTQKQLADQLHLSHRTISKWERGAGSPDISLLAPLSSLLRLPMETLLAGEAPQNDQQGGNMRKTQFYVCPTCGNILTASAEAALSCCGETLSPLQAQKPPAEEDLVIEGVEDEYYLTSPHEMTKTHFIAFVAFLTGERLLLLRQYPEWELQCRLPRHGHGLLLWYCTRHGLYKKII